MDKRGTYFLRLMPLLHGENQDAWLEEFLIAESNLPGPRANLELAWAFADCFEKISLTEGLFTLLKQWSSLSSHQAPTGKPREFLPFCSLQALGSSFLRAGPKYKEQIIAILRASSGDSRWRTREAVAMGFQRMAEQDFSAARQIFSHWMAEAALVEKRAILAALAHSPLLTDSERVRFCLKLTEDVLKDVQNLSKQDRKTEGFRILKQGLEYTISLFVEHLPEQGFAYLKKWAEQEDVDIKKILKSNLTKARLSKKHGNAVHALLESL